MDGPTAQARIYRGYGIAAEKIGLPYVQYRPQSAAPPIVDANKLATLPASFNAEDFTYMRPNKYGKPTWFAIVDGSQTQVGDYLVGAAGTYFIAGQQPLLPILAVECNRSIRIGRMADQGDAGFVGYSGDVQSAEVDVLGTAATGGTFGAGWPASILLGGRSDKDTVLPSSVKQSGVVILLPVSVPVQILESDIVQDDLGRNFAIYAAELTDLGWRLQANEEHS